MTVHTDLTLRPRRPKYSPEHQMWINPQLSQDQSGVIVLTPRHFSALSEGGALTRCMNTLEEGLMMV